MNHAKTQNYSLIAIKQKIVVFAFLFIFSPFSKRSMPV